jgi:hypothetical protein
MLKMIRLYFFTGLLILVMSCTTKRAIPGHYLSESKSYYMDLKLEKDGAFYIMDAAGEYNKKGKGIWEIKNSDTLVLNFKDNQTGHFQSIQDYVAGQRLTFYITKSGKLKLYKLTLKKVK